MAETTPNLLAALLAAVASFAVGGLWYAPILFGRPWQRLAELTDDDLKARNPAVIFGGSFGCALVGAVVLALFLGADAGAGFGALAGALVGVGWVASSLVTTYLFERRPMALAAVDGGYHAVSYTVMGVLIGWLG